LKEADNAGGMIDLAGIAHVISRMDWYCALTEHLFSAGICSVSSVAFLPLQQNLRPKRPAIKMILPLENFGSSRTPSPAGSPESCSTQCSSPGLTETTSQCSMPAGDAHEPNEESEVNVHVENSPGK
jgi:hypothetical protein